MEISIENREKIIAMLSQGICPICNKSYLEPLRHISRSHGISAREIKDALLLPRSSSFIPQEQSEKYRQNAIEHDFKSRFVPGKTKKPDSNTREKMREKAISRLKERPELLQAFKEGKKKAQSNAIERSNETNRKSVMKISPNGEIKAYKSMADAERDGNVHNSNISRCIKYKRLDSRGNRWSLLAKNKGESKNE